MTHRPVAGLDPATHVFFAEKTAAPKDVDARDKPGQGVIMDETVA